MSLLEIEGIDVYYEDSQALYDVSLKVEEGEIFACIGANGAGKSTMLKTVSGVLVPGRGRIMFDGRSTDHMATHLRVEMGIYKDVLQELEDRGMLEMTDAAGMTLSEQGRETLEDSLRESYRRGDLTAEELAEPIKNDRAMPAPPSQGGTRTRLSAQAENELIAEMMDFQHQGRSESTSLEDLYVHYAVGEKKGLKIDSKKVDYDRLKIMVHELEKRGVLKLTGEQKRFALSHLSLEKLLKGLIQRQKGQMLEKRAFRREHEVDKTDVRRYQRGDVFKNISIRHTLRRVLRKGKTVEDINTTDLRAFEKKPMNQLDIAVCVDISASMKEGGKLTF